MNRLGLALRVSGQNQPAIASPSAIARSGALVLLYLALTAWQSFPFVMHLRTHLAAVHDWNAFDTLYSAWALAYETHALSTAPATLPDANIYHPTSRALFYGPNAFGALPFFAPTFLATGNPALALNVMFLLSLALTAATLHWVVWRWTDLHLAGLIAAWTFLTTRWVFWEWLPTAPHAAVLGYFPLIIFLAARPAARFADTLRLLPLVVLQALTEVTYLAPALVGPLVVLAVGRLVRRRTRAAGFHLLAVLALAAVVLLPVLAEYLAVEHANPALRQQTLWHLRERPLPLPWGPFESFTPLTVAPVVLVLIVGGVIARHLHLHHDGPPLDAWLHASYWTVLGLVMSLTPVMLWHGRYVRLPHAWLGPWLPLYRFVRIPSRLGIVGLMGVCLLAGLAFAECARLAGRARVPLLVPLCATVALASLYVQYTRGFTWPFPRGPLPHAYPLQPAIVPDEEFLTALRPGRGPLLELPINRLDSAKPYLQAAAMYRSIFHWRPLVNGYSSYYPVDFPVHMMLAQRLPDPGAVAMLRARTGLAMVLVHAALLPPADRAAWLALENRDDLRLLRRRDDDLLFAVTPSDRSDGQP